jgi:hypothetical protein
VAFLRFNRDKRGYEHFYLVEATTNRRGKTRARVLYWFRSPPNIKVGRQPFDDEARRALEAQNPGVAFDWRKISETPIPSADVERWRERRRLERAERAARKEQAAAPVPQADLSAEVEDSEPDELDAETEDLSVDAAEQQADALGPKEELPLEAAAPAAVPAGDSRRRRRRRRRRSGTPSAPPASSGE